MTKKEIANAVGILLNLDTIHHKELQKLSDDCLNQMFRNYIKNAQAYNHLEDELRIARCTK